MKKSFILLTFLCLLFSTCITELVVKTQFNNQYLLSTNNQYLKSFNGSSFTSSTGNNLILSFSSTYLSFSKKAIFNPTIELTGNGYGTSSNDVVLSSDGKIAYVADSSKVAILDVSDPSKIDLSLISEYTPDVGTVIRSLYLEGNRLYLGSSNYLVILDASNSANLVKIGHYQALNHIRKIEVFSQIAYIATDSGIEIVDCTSGSSPSQNGAIANGLTYDISVDSNENLIYATSTNNISIYNVSSLSSIASSSITQGRAVWSKNRFIYYATTTKMYILVLAEFSGFFFIGEATSINLPDVATSIKIFDSNKLFVTCSGAGLLVYEIDGFKDPSLLAQYNTPNLANRVAIHQNMAYVADSTSGVLPLFFNSFIEISGTLPLGSHQLNITACNFLEECAVNSFYVKVGCEIGYYIDSESCSICPTNSTTNITGGSSRDDCLCSKGFEPFGNPFVCQQCQIDYYKESLGNTNCLQCSTNTTTNSSTGSNSVLDCICKEGYYEKVPNSCFACEVETFKSIPGPQGCDVCPQNSTTDGEIGSVQCICNVGHYKKEGNCEPCPLNTFKNTTGNQQCQSCPSNSQSNGTFCSCLQGFESVNNLCVACSFDHYKDTIGNSNCLACLPEESTNGTTGATSKSQCLCKQGYYLDTTTQTCSQCLADTWKSLIGNQNCTVCPSFSTTSGVLGSTSNTCQCEKGYFFDGIKTCVICDADKYKENIGNDLSCSNCTIYSSTNNITGSISNSSCICNPGYYKNQSGECTNCPINTYKNQTGDLESLCSFCPSNSFSSEASKSLNDCICKNNWIDGSSMCSYCPPQFNESNDCLGCVGNLNSQDNCTTCLNFWQDTSTNCTICPQNYNQETGCDRCLNYWESPISGCLSCPTNYETTECKNCTGFWNSPETGCSSCDFDHFNQSCTGCKDHWYGGNCLECDFSRFNQSCNGCINFFQGDSCQICPENFNIASNCSICQTNYDISSNCTSCLSNFNVSVSCLVCNSGYTGSMCEILIIPPNYDAIVFFSVVTFIFCICCSIGCIFCLILFLLNRKLIIDHLLGKENFDETKIGSLREKKLNIAAQKKKQEKEKEKESKTEEEEQKKRRDSIIAIHDDSEDDALGEGEVMEAQESLLYSVDEDNNTYLIEEFSDDEEHFVDIATESKQPKEEKKNQNDEPHYMESFNKL